MCLTGYCHDCEIHFIAAGYPELVKMWQDHLREHHPDKWLRA